MFFDSASMQGSTGIINAPSAYVLPYNVFGVGIHRFDLNAAFGVLPACEIGLKVNTLGDYTEWVGDAKSILKFMDFSLGGGIEARYTLPVSAYAVTGWAAEQILYGFFLNLGYGNGRFNSILNGFFLSGGIVIYPGAIFLGENDGMNYNAGLRLLLSDRLKMDAFVLKTDQLNREPNLAGILQNHVLFGLFYSEPLVISL